MSSLREEAVQRLELAGRRLPRGVRAPAERAWELVDPAYRRAWAIQFAREQRRWAKQNGADPRARPELPPIPPSRLRTRVGAGIRLTPYHYDGAEWAKAVGRVLGLSVEGVGVIYDWGCGSGKILRHLAKLHSAGVRVMGSDVDADAVAWINASIPGVEALVNGFEPPLPAGAGEVGCLISSSILTHLPEDAQDRWLAEIGRVMKPSGVALISILGPEWHGRFTAPGRVTESRDCTERLRAAGPPGRGELRFVPYDVSAGSEKFPGITGSYGLTLHDHDYIRAHWGRYFGQIEIEPGAVNSGQDLVICRAPLAGA